MILGLGLSIWPARVPAGTGGVAGGGYRFWRVLVDNTRAETPYVSMSEISLYAPGSEVNLVTPSTPVTVSSYDPYFPIINVVDGAEEDYGWLSQEANLMGQWVTLDLGQVRQVELVKINPTTTELFRPTRVVIQASNDQLTGYVTLAEVNAPSWAPDGFNTPASAFGPLPPQT